MNSQDLRIYSDETIEAFLRSAELYGDLEDAQDYRLELFQRKYGKAGTSESRAEAGKVA